jgi:hypothetical protein
MQEFAEYGVDSAGTCKLSALYELRKVERLAGFADAVNRSRVFSD